LDNLLAAALVSAAEPDKLLAAAFPAITAAQPGNCHGGAVSRGCGVHLGIAHCLGRGRECCEGQEVVQTTGLA